MKKKSSIVNEKSQLKQREINITLNEQKNTIKKKREIKKEQKVSKVCQKGTKLLWR